MRISEVTGPALGSNVQYQPTIDKGPKTPEELAAINAERAASGQQAADVADYNARQSSGLYAQSPKPAAPVTSTEPTNVVSDQVTAAPAKRQWGVGVLGMGSQGPEVEALQRRLGITPDGKFGQQTKDAVIALQKKIGVTPDGAYGPKTKAADGKQMPALPAQKPAPEINLSVQPKTTQATPPRDNFAQANAYMDQQDAAAKQKWIDNRARRAAAGQRSDNANAVVDSELANMDKETAEINASAKYSVQPAKVGMNGEMDYVVVDKIKGLEVKSFNSQAEADAWIKQQPIAESLARLLQIAGLR